MSSPAQRATWTGIGPSDRSNDIPPPPASRSGLDLLSQNEGDLPRRREARDAGAEVVASLFRLVKLSTMHAADNQAVVQRVEEMVEAIRTYSARTSRNVSILFLDDGVFVGGQLLQGNRASYECARELGSILGRVGVSEVGISREARAADFHALANLLGETLRAPRGTRAPERPSPRLRLRAASALALRREGPTDRLDPAANAANAYASACVVMRRLYEALGKGQAALPHRVKRVALRLVDLSAGELPAFLGVTDAKRGAHDDAQRVVNATILTLAMARQITGEPVLLSRIAMASLLSDIGRFHMAGAFPGSGRIVPQLGADQEREVPAATAMLLTAMGRVNEPTVIRTVLAYEACAIARKDAFGSPYEGARSATLQAFMMAIARAYVDGIAGSLGAPARTADETIGHLIERWPDGLGRTALRLLIGALGLFPAGTLVELSTGEVAAVVATPADPSRYSRPRVRVVLDMAGHPVDPFEIDLANPEPGTMARHIRKVVTDATDVAAVSVRASHQTPAPRTPRPSPATMPPPARPGAGLGAVRLSKPAASRPRPAPISAPPTRMERVPVALDFDDDIELPGFKPAPASAAPETLGSAGVELSLEEDREALLPDAGLRDDDPTEYHQWTGIESVDPDYTPPYGHESQDLIAQTMPEPALTEQQRPSPIIDPQRLSPVHDTQRTSLPEGHRPSPILDTQRTSLPEGHRPSPILDTQRTSLPEGHRPSPILDTQRTSLPEGHRPSPILDTQRTSIPEAQRLSPITQAPPRGSAPEAQRLSPASQTPQRGSAPEAQRPSAVTAPQRPASAEQPRPAATAEGTFARTPFVHLLVYVLDQSLTGTVTFFPPEGPPHDVYFEQGVAAKIRTGTMIWPLDRVLVHLRMLDEPTVNEALLELSKSKMLLGRQLVAKGLCSRDDVLRALRVQLVYKLISLCDLPPQTAYAFYADKNLLKDYGGPELLRSEPLATIMAAVRASPATTASEATLARFARLPLGFVKKAVVTRFELTREEDAVCDLLRAKHMRMASLVAAGVAPEHVVKRTIYALIITRYLDLGGAQKPPVSFAPGVSLGAVLSLPEQRPPAPGSAEAARTANLGADRPDAPVQTSMRPPDATRPSLKGASVAAEPVPPPRPPEDTRPSFQGAAPSPRAAAAPKPPPTPASAGSPPKAAPAAASKPPLPGASKPPPPGASKPANKPGAAINTPSPTATDIAARRAEIQARSASIDHENYFEVLGLSRNATPEETRKAYFALAKRWHPDRTPPELAEMKPLVARVFAKIGEAYAALGDSEKRVAYARSLESPVSVRSAAEEEEVVRAVNAVLEFQKAEVFVRKNDLVSAERHIRLAADADPGQPEYTTLLAWVTALRRGEPKDVPQGATTNHYDDLIKMLDEVLRGDPRYERALFYRGTLLKRSGKADKAMRDFRLAAELNPKNLDAVREVRLFEMRKREGRDQQGGEAQGLFGKWFKR